jgi:TRAP-type mannitol/chloroaromatic compound transport system substrate-binding protein
MKRREFIKKAGLGVAAAGALIPSLAAAKGKTLKWKMSTSYPPRFPILQDGCERLAKRIETMSGGSLKIQVFAGGELIGPFDVWDAVSQGKAIQVCSTAAYYFPGKLPVVPLFSAIPFGFTAMEASAWQYRGGGLELYREIMKPFNIYPIPHMSTGTQMGGWFRKEIKSVDDIKGLRFRIPGLGGKVMAKLGANVVLTPGSEIFTALERGIIDACEWAVPLYDLRLGLHQAAKYYYYPGWQEPTTTVDLWVNLKTWESLSTDLKAIIEAACAESLNLSLAEGVDMNSDALKELVEKHGVIVKQFPDGVLKAMKKATREVLEEQCRQDPQTKKVYDSYRKFEAKIRGFRKINELAYYKAVEL